MVCDRLISEEVNFMNKYVTGAVIRKLREDKNMTQEELAEKIFVSSKTVSKWETGKGFPDISLLETLAKALNISVIELLNGEDIKNLNRSANISKSSLYVCPVCGNVIQSAGEAVVSCCGIVIPPLVPEEPDENHTVAIESVEDEYFVHIAHPMSKEHYISFIIAVSDFGTQFVKLYPEGNAETRFKKNRVEKIYFYCNRHGLFKSKIK